MSATRDNYLKQAIQNEQDAANTTLDNVRERALRSALAWRQMAERLTRAEAMRATREVQEADPVLS
jgi:hypothetical protein